VDSLSYAAGGADGVDRLVDAVSERASWARGWYGFRKPEPSRRREHAKRIKITLPADPKAIAV
jgi:hypothetical protein